MVPHDRDESVVENAPTPNVPISLVVVPYAEVVPQTNPLTVDDALPLSVILAFNVAVEEEIEVGVEVDTIGGLVITSVHEPVTKLESPVVVVPAELIAYAA